MLRARIVLLAGRGIANPAIALQLGCDTQTVRKWRGRFFESSVAESLDDAKRSGRPPRISVASRCGIIKLACARPEDNHAPFRDVWTHAALRDAFVLESGITISLSEIGRILRAEGLRPHRMRLWLHSPDPDFAGKVERICKLYCTIPPGATVLCIDEKPMQVTSRKYPSKPSRRRRDGRWEFEYRRHGTLTLIGAFDIKTGIVFGQCRKRRTNEDILEYMEAVAARWPTGPVYVVWDNLNIHHGERWREFSARHGGRFHFVHTPLHASWVNQIEIWFGILQRRILKRGDFANRAALHARVDGFIQHWNRCEAHPFRWTFRGRFVQHPQVRAA